VFALTDAGARVLDDGIALRASDIVVVYLAGYGSPPHDGGPMHYANRVGLPAVLDALRSFHDDGWQPAPLLVRLAAENGRFV
jgi:3-hydroxyacyl-CoA dehydrogenase